MQPIEESYSVMNRYNLTFNDGNAERVDSLSYGWKKVSTQVGDTPRRSFLRVTSVYMLQGREVQDHLLKIQPTFKADLLNGVTQFVVDVNNFVGEYDEK